MYYQYRIMSMKYRRHNNIIDFWPCKFHFILTKYSDYSVTFKVS